MRTVAVFHKDEVPIELGIPGKGTNRIQLRLGVLSALHRQGQGLRQLHQLVGDIRGTGVDLFLDGMNLGNQVLMALGAFRIDEPRVLQRLSR